MQEVESAVLDTGEATIHVERVGSGPAVLLLHGFPETLAMWRDIAPDLATRFSVVCADLRGYGASGCPPSAVDHEPYSKRAMARDMVSVMTELGFERFLVAGHDRGGRVAYRLALDYPERVQRLAVLDIVPIDSAWSRADERFALGFWPWSLLAQAEPLPERLLGAAPEAVIDHALSPEWSTPGQTFSAEARAQYIDQLKDPHTYTRSVRYRAAASIDAPMIVPTGSRAADHVQRLRCGATSGPLASWYADAGGPLQIWRDLAPRIAGWPVPGGHFFPEEHPADTARALDAFFSGDLD